jgi:hypothetical protein
VRVQILDENDNKPIFDKPTFYFEIREDSSSDTTVNPTDVKVIATDADIDKVVSLNPDHGEVYSILCDQVCQ